MKLLWLSWKDIQHPLGGGAEVVTDSILSRLVLDGHDVTLLTGGYVGAKHEDQIHGYHIIRVGGRFSVYWYAYKYYKKHLSNIEYDLVIEEVNTIPFFSKFYIKVKSNKAPVFLDGTQSVENAVSEMYSSTTTKVESNANSESTFDSQLLTFNSPRHFLFFHQLARQIWFYEMPFPLSLIGYLIEPLYLRLLASAFPFNFSLSTFNSPSVITVSMSTTHDLMRYGFKQEHIHIISEGVDVPALETLGEKNDQVKSEKAPVFLDGTPSAENAVSKTYSSPTQKDNTNSESTFNSQLLTFNSSNPIMLSLGSLRAMKRTIDTVKAFEDAKGRMPSLKLIIAGDASSAYGQKVASLVARSIYSRDITMLGRVTDEQKTELMTRAHLIVVTSIKEGWGLIVTEAGRRGTPAVVYNVDGLRDSVHDGISGLVSKHNNPKSLALSITELLSKPEYYKGIRKNAWKRSKKVTFEKQYQDFKIVVGLSPHPDLRPDDLRPSTI